MHSHHHKKLQPRASFNLRTPLAELATHIDISVCEWSKFQSQKKFSSIESWKFIFRHFDELKGRICGKISC